MSTKAQFNPASILLVLLGGAVLTAGCVNLKKSYPDVRVYSLDPGAQPHTAYGGPAMTVTLNRFSILPQFSDRYFAYRTGEASYESDFYNQMMAEPVAIIKNQTEKWLKNSPVVKFILPADVVSGVCYVIEGRVLDFYGDYRETSDPKAVLEIEMTVSGQDPAGNTVLLQKIYSESIGIGKTSAPVLVEGWNRALGKILGRFEDDLKKIAAGGAGQ
jgi:hypothetical protein